jgi:hypothetical protein
MTIDVVTTLLAFFSVSVFLAHALDAYRAAATTGQNLRARLPSTTLGSPLVNPGVAGIRSPGRSAPAQGWPAAGALTWVLEYRKSCSDHSGYKGHLRANADWPTQSTLCVHPSMEALE